MKANDLLPNTVVRGGCEIGREWLSPMKTISLTLLHLVLIPLPLRSEDVFSPVEPAIFRSPIGLDSEDYQSFLAKTVFRGFSGDWSMVFCALPSFQPEWGLSFADVHQRGYLLHLSVAPESLWDAAGFLRPEGEMSFTREEREKYLLPKIEIKKVTKEIDRELGARIIAAWHGVLFRARLGPAHLAVGVDGVVYYYFATDLENHAFAGKSWMPAEGSGADRLADLAYALRGLAEGASGAEEEVEAALKVLENCAEATDPAAAG